MPNISIDIINWIKALHIISVVSWMVGLLYLPRLFVYHCNARVGSELYETLIVMERRLLQIIMLPAMFSSLLFGFILVLGIGIEIWFFVWWNIKFGCVVVMLFLQWRLCKWQKCFESNTNIRSQKFFRYLNEGPTVLMIVIVIMAVVEPF